MSQLKRSILANSRAIAALKTATDSALASIQSAVDSLSDQVVNNNQAVSALNESVADSTAAIMQNADDIDAVEASLDDSEIYSTVQGILGDLFVPEA